MGFNLGFKGLKWWSLLYVMVFIFITVCCTIMTIIMHTRLERNGRTMFHCKEIDYLCFQESTVIMHILLDELQGLVTSIFDYTSI